MAYDESSLGRSDPYRWSSRRPRRLTPGGSPYSHGSTDAAGELNTADTVPGYGEVGASGQPQPDGGQSSYQDHDATSSLLAAAVVEPEPREPAVAEPESHEPEPEASPPRDRLAVHWLWELVLLLAVGGLGYLLWRNDPDLLRGENLSTLLVYATAYGLLGLGAGVTLRAGAPNLAIGPVAAAAMLYFAQEGGDGVVPPTLLATGAAVALGVAVALVIILFEVPGWAASLAASLAVLVWIGLQPEQVALAGAYDPTSQATFLFLTVAAIGMLGGLIASLQSVRRSLGRYRPVGDPGERRGPGAALMAGFAVVVSMALAVPAGVLLAAVSGDPVVAGSGLELTGIGMAVALVGGASAFGRRGGVLGGTLAVAGLVLFHEYQRLQGWRISLLATAAVALVIGLLVSRIVETFGRSRQRPSVAASDDESQTRFSYLDPEANSSPTTESTAGSWSTGTDSWSSALPAQPAPNRPDPWHDDSWPGR